MNATMNGRARKSLAEQIDRLDRMLDGLADGLNDAIAAAVQQAVKQVLVEVLTNPELQERFRATSQAAVESSQPAEPVSTEAAAPSLTTRAYFRCRQFGSWLKARLLAGFTAVQTAAHAVAATCRRGCERFTQRCTAIQRQVGGLLTMAWFVLYGVRHLAGAVLTASAAGAAAGIAAYHLSPLVAAITSGASGFVATMAVHVVLWFRQTLLHWPVGGR